MSQYWSKIIADLDPYVPGEQPRERNLVKLNTNESPYPPSPRVAEAIAAFDLDRLRRYPDPLSRDLVAALADYHGLETDQVFVGNGSDEVLAHSFQAFFRQDLPLLFPDISYSFYPVYCKLYEIDYRPIALDENFEIRVRDFATDNGGIILPNPNAPTGIALELAAIRELLADNPESVVVIDEAYVDFGAASATSLIDEFDNLLVVQTFSKSRNLAGARLGFALGHADLIEGLQRVKNSFNSYPVDSLSNVIGLAALADDRYFRDCCQRVVDNRETLSGQLRELGFEVLPSRANFVFVRHPGQAAARLYRQLKDDGILVRYFDKPRIDEYLRISIGNDDECAALLACLRRILA